MQEKNKSKSYFKALIGFAVLLIFVLIIYYILENFIVNDASYDNTITVINAGQGQAVLIQSQDEYLIIDAGGTKDEEVLLYLNERIDKEINTFLITHFHEDHYSLADDILLNFEVENVVIPNLSDDNLPNTQMYDNFLEIAESEEINLILAKENDTYKIGQGNLEIITDTPQSVEDVNDTSIVSVFYLDDFSYLSTGDINAPYEEELIEKIDSISLFNASHHGSKYSNDTEFLMYINPALVIFSAGEDNSYYHPHKRVLDDLINLGIPYLITYKEGNIIYSIDEEKVLEEFSFIFN